MYCDFLQQSPFSPNLHQRRCDLNLAERGGNAKETTHHRHGTKVGRVVLSPEGSGARLNRALEDSHHPSEVTVSGHPCYFITLLLCLVAIPDYRCNHPQTNICHCC